MNFYDFEHPFDDDFDDLSDYGDGTLAALSGASVWGGEGFLGPPSYSQSVGASLWSSSALVPTIDTLEPADIRLVGEIMSLPGRLARCQQLAALSRAYELCDTFMADPLPGSASPVPTPPPACRGGGGIRSPSRGTPQSCGGGCCCRTHAQHGSCMACQC
jgi:hypothetical protein